MPDSDKAQFYNDTLKRHIGLNELAGEIKSYINEKPKSNYTIRKNIIYLTNKFLKCFLG